MSANESATACLSAVTTTGENKEDCEAALASTVAAKDAAQDYEEAANLSKIDAEEAKDLAQAAAAQVDVAGALAGLPPRVGSELKVVRVKADGTGFEYVEYIQRLHVLSAAAATKNAITSMLPILDLAVSTINSLDVKKVLVTPSGFLSYFSAASDYCETSSGGATWVQRTIGAAAAGNPWTLVNNGNNVIAFTRIASPNTFLRYSSDGGITWSIDIALTNIWFEYVAYVNTGKCLAVQGGQCKISTDNGVTWGAAQTIPHTPAGIGVIALGDTFVSIRPDSATYYTSTTGLTGSWTARTLPDGITANKVWEDGAGGLVVVSTTTSKNLRYTTDGVTWIDAGFSQDSMKYGGLSAAASNAASFVCPVRINGCWVLFNGTSANGGAGAWVKYGNNTWVPMLVDCGNLANTDNTRTLVAVKSTGTVVIKEAAANNKAHLVIAGSTKCIGHFI